MIKVFISFLLISVGITFAQKASDIDIPYKQYKLKNGLTLIVHEDHKAPIVAVNIWYHVGSKNEKQGKTGFAHLFEHLMFNGSENYDDDYFQVLERVGATDLNGTTNNDRTNYFQNVPTSAFDLALWMESDRMGHLLGAINQEKLDEQRGVVQNEKRQGDNQPYAIAEELITENTYPKGHPYSWTVIGSMEDLNAASLEDVHEWFKTYYGAANAVLVIAGDVNPEEVYQKVEKYFGDIPSGPPVKKHEKWVAKMTETKRSLAYDRVPQSRIYKVWNIPEWGNEETTMLDLVTDVLSMGKNSRLYKRLVYDDQIATSAYSYFAPGEIASQLYIVADVKPGVELSVVEKAIDEELARFLKDGPTENELQRVKTQYFAGFIRGIERIGGFGGKSDKLAESMVYGGSPDYYKTILGYVEKATVSKLKNAANKWLDSGVYILEIHPFPEYQTVQSDVDRSKLPETGTPPDVVFPKFDEATLSNGMKVYLAHRTAVPLINFSLQVDAGFAADQFAFAGVASMMSAMMDEGTKKRNALQISEELMNLGSYLNTGAGLDNCFVTMSTLKVNLDKSLDLFADVTLNPSFPKEELERQRQQRLASIKREKSSPVQMGFRVLPKFLYGSGHAYSTPFTGSGYEANVEKMTVEDLKQFHSTWFKPNNSSLIVVGDITMDELKPKLEKLFKDWKPGETPKKNIANVSIAQKPVIYLLNKTGAVQSIILGGQIAPPKSDPDDIAIGEMNNILGGSFTSRINMNLREEKHWSYGSGSMFFNAKGQRPFLAYGIVQTDKTKESLLEMYKEMKDIISTKPITEDETQKTILNSTLSLPGSWETNSAVLGSISEIVNFNLPKNYFQIYDDKVKSLTPTDLNNAAKKVLFPDNIIWVIVGDKDKIENGLKEIGYEIKYIDADGNILE